MSKWYNKTISKKEYELLSDEEKSKELYEHVIIDEDININEYPYITGNKIISFYNFIFVSSHYVILHARPQWLLPSRLFWWDNILQGVRR